MKKLILALALTAFGTVATQITAQAQQTTTPAPDPKAPKFQFVGGDSHDFGNLKEGDPASYIFVFKNTGKKPLVITAVNAGCGCTTPEWGTKDANGVQQPMVVAPGKKGEIKVSYNTPGRVGSFDKPVWITSNAVPSPNQERYELHIKGNVAASGTTIAPTTGTTTAPTTGRQP